MMSRKRIPVEIVQKYRLLLALLLAILLLAAAWYLTNFQTTPETNSQLSSSGALPTLTSVLANLGSSLIAFTFIVWLFSKENEAIVDQKQEEKNLKLIQNTLASTAKTLDENVRKAISESFGTAGILETVQWAQMIENSSEIDFFVQGWDGWFGHNKITDALRMFFERDGIFRIYLYNAKSVGGQRVREDMGKRIGRAPINITVEIENTISNLREVQSSCSAGKVEVIETEQMIWYFGALFTGRKTSSNDKGRDVMVFSVYSHTPRRPWYMPAIIIYPDTQKHDFRSWFQKELDYLRADSSSMVESNGDLNYMTINKSNDESQ